MMRQKILNTLLIASFGAMAATAAAQTTAPAQNDTPRNAPIGNTAAPPTTESSVPADMRGYKNARAACDKQPLDSRDQCRTTLNTRYSAVAPKCQKLSGSALDDCLKGADTGQ